MSTTESSQNNSSNTVAEKQQNESTTHETHQTKPPMDYIETDSAITAEGFEDGPMQIESLCVQCGHNKGITRLLLTKIPHFREVILVSFYCPNCHWKNTEIQFGGKYGEKGMKLTLQVKDQKDLSRQIVKSDYCTAKIPAADFEIPMETQRGVLTTVEGLISKAVETLKEQQPVRKYTQPDLFYTIEAAIEKLESLLQLEEPFVLELDDPSGNSNIENLCTPQEDPQIKRVLYPRTNDQNHMIGLGVLDDQEQARLDEKREKERKLKQKIEEHKAKTARVVNTMLEGEEAAKFEKSYVTTSQNVDIIPQDCANCGQAGDLRMVLCHVPHFGEVIIMAFICNNCGFKTNEVKPGGGVPEKGRRITLKVTNPDDMNRDVLKSDSCAIDIPEIPLHVSEGTLGGKFTTIEGLIAAVEDQFVSMGTFTMGDSEYSSDKKMSFMDFIKKLQKLKTGEEEFTFIVDDPLANSYVQNIYAPDPDPNMVIEEYERSYEQDEDLGLHDMVVEGYEEDEEKGKE